ncbi:MAG: hypothetical protein B7Z75_14235 [Acidocella sp. 20-57-95]|nr:MAG: hypothetical protein B7Z75_14235 [Acidocella sp. 20-57-95]
MVSRSHANSGLLGGHIRCSDLHCRDWACCSASWDADAFKDYNDLYGHPAGDRCLKELANALVTSCRHATFGW